MMPLQHPVGCYCDRCRPRAWFKASELDDAYPVMGVLLFAGLPLMLAIACGTTHAQNASTAGAYAAEQDMCVEQAKTLEESRACRCAHPAANGHVPAFCKDGGQ